MKRNRLPNFVDRQDNSTPRCIRNAAIFDGLLLRGKLSLAPIQKIGAVVYALLPLVAGIITIVATWTSDANLISDQGPPAEARVLNFIASLLALLMGVAFMIIGVRVVFNTLMKRSLRKSRLHR